MTARLTQGPRLVLLAGSALGLGVLLSLWPSLVVAVGAIGLVAALAWLRPEYGFVFALALFGFEGSLKKGLTFDTLPVSVSGATLGAGVLDLCLLAAGAALLYRRRATLRAAWAGADRVLRVGVLLFAAWLALAVLQIPQSGHLVRGVNGFRLIHWYVLAAAGGVLLARSRRRALDLLFVFLLVVAAYGALRGVIGPSVHERAFALSRSGVTQYGSAFRDIGSFSGAVGLASFLAPAGIFAFVLALLSPRWRIPGLVVAACALVAVIDSYARVAIVAMFGAVVLAAVLMVRAAQLPRRRTVLAVSAILAALVLGAAGTVLASRSSPQLKERVHAFVHPLADESVHLRLDTWRDSLTELTHHPLGTGLGTVGRARAASTGQQAVTTDNSNLEIQREQGFLGGILFMLGIVVTVAGLIAGVGRAPADRRPLAIAAVCAFVCFAVLAAAGEYIEQPGKVLAWTLLGLAAGAVSIPAALDEVDAE
jgi:O-antigen ligase